MKYLLLLPLLFALGTAQATSIPCDHRVLYNKQCDYPELKGEKGDPGKDGVDGINGVDGADGESVDPLALASTTEDVYEFIDNMRATHLAFDSIEILLPQVKQHRVTLNLTGNGRGTGNGIGYAYMFDGDSRTAVYIGFGEAEGIQAGKLGISFEF